MNAARAALGVLLVGAAVIGAGCAAGPRPARPPSLSTSAAERVVSSRDDKPVDGRVDGRVDGWVWRVRLRPGQSLDVGGVDLRLCFTGAAPRRVVPDSPLALAFLSDGPRATDASDARGRPLVVDDDGIVTAGLPPRSCVAFGVDLEAAARLQRVDLALRLQRALLASPDVWLWRPRPWPPGVTGSLVIEGDDARALVALPFADDGRGGLLVPPSTFTLPPYGLFGRRREHVLERAHARLRVLVTGDPAAVDVPRLAAWLATAVDDVATPLGRFPATDGLLVAAPLSGTPAVLGGFLGRGGGLPSVVVLLGRVAPAGEGGDDRDGEDDDAPDEDGRWVLTHELSHTLLPPVVRGDAWLNEGLATWHQEVLPARSGRRRPDVARAQLALGFATGAQRAREDGLSLERACAGMDAHGAYQHCYWGGAALFALLADEVGDDGVTALVTALHALAPLDAPPRPALALLDDVADGKDEPPAAAAAARALIALWQRFRDRPFPETPPRAAAGSSSSSGASG